uniref:Pentacotripeptide-repeat region of PRORP domain-containing protein n=1 Tax=Cucumis sativus TaxID=3659 RepID=A0A0A0L3A3_CUCSA
MVNLTSLMISIRQNSRFVKNLRIHIRNLSVETNGGNNGREEIESSEKLLNLTQRKDVSEIAAEVGKVIRSKPRWEQSLLSDYPSFNFHDPSFFSELLKQLNNVFLSLRFFLWLSSQPEFLPHPVSCNKLFDALLEAKACVPAKSFLYSFEFSPEPASLENYIRCVCEGGLVEEAVYTFDMLKEAGYRPYVETWNFAFQSCLKFGRTDLIWKLYEGMMETGVQKDVDIETVGYLIQAFCNDNKVSRAYEILRQSLEDGLTPCNDAFNKLISGFCKEKNHHRVLELVHTMIVKNRNPDIFTYQEIINGFCKNWMTLQAFEVFNALKDRGYAPDMVMYTTLIHGFCKMGQLEDASKLWFEMIDKGFLPNEYSYNTLIYGFCKIGNLDEAMKLYKKMLDSGYKETTLSCNTLILGLCLHGRTDEAYDFFREMPCKNIVCDVITYNTLIQGFCREGKVLQSTDLLKELQAKGLQPSTSSYAHLIQKLCQLGSVQEAKEMWNDMHNRGLQPMVCTRDHIISGLCEQGYVVEGMEWLITMLKSNLKPQKETFYKLIQSLIQIGKELLLELKMDSKTSKEEEKELACEACSSYRRWGTFMSNH